MTKKEQRELLALVFQAQMHQDRCVRETEGTASPQTMAIHYKAQGGLEALQAVADALRGSRNPLRIVAGLYPYYRS